MSDEPVGPFSRIVSVRPGRNRLAHEDRELADARRRLQQKGGGKKHGKSRGEGEGQRDGQQSRGHEDIHDDVSVFGIPKEEMTESVRGAIDLLMEEIQHLRAELARAQGHEHYLEEQAEKDRLLHVMRRRAFMARVNLGVQRVTDEQAQFSFIYVAIANASAVRSEFGHGAVETLMVQAAGVLRESMVPGDVVGSLEQFDFGVLLPGTPLAEAIAKAEALVQALKGRSFMWQGQSISIDAVFGVTELAPADSAEEVIDRAKRDRGERAGS